MVEQAGAGAFGLETLEQSGFGPDDVLAFIEAMDDDMDPPLRLRLDVPAYVEKFLRHARVLVAHDGQEIAGLVAMYANDQENRTAYITYLGVARKARGHGLARKLMAASLRLAAETGMTRMRLETADTNEAARRLYESLGFEVEEIADNRGQGVKSIRMVKTLSPNGD